MQKQTCCNKYCCSKFVSRFFNPGAMSLVVSKPSKLHHWKLPLSGRVFHVQPPKILSTTFFHRCNQKINISWLGKYSWLQYSPKLDRVFCGPFPLLLTALALMRSHYHAHIDVDTVCKLFLQKHSCSMEAASLFWLIGFYVWVMTWMWQRCGTKDLADSIACVAEILH